MIYLWVGIYLIGAVLTYFLNRYGVKKEFNTYTTSCRFWGLFFSVYSWIGFIAVLLTRHNGILNIDEDKIANW